MDTVVSDKYFEKALQWVNKRKVESVKANYEGYESPKSYTNQRTNETVCPDISFVDERGVKNYVEVAVKSDSIRKTVTKWKLLSTLAGLKNGNLYLLAVRGSKSFVKSEVEKCDLSAKIYSL
ncbi:MAG: hypothetical protein R2730_07760 [Chitinophagales bacterium]